jgi:hypothetical protein
MAYGYCTYLLTTLAVKQPKIPKRDRREIAGFVRERRTELKTLARSMGPHSRLIVVNDEPGALRYMVAGEIQGIPWLEHCDTLEQAAARFSILRKCKKNPTVWAMVLPRDGDEWVTGKAVPIRPGLYDPVPPKPPVRWRKCT